MNTESNFRGDVPNCDEVTVSCREVTGILTDFTETVSTFLFCGTSAGDVALRPSMPTSNGVRYKVIVHTSAYEHALCHIFVPSIGYPVVLELPGSGRRRCADRMELINQLKLILGSDCTRALLLGLKALAMRKSTG